MNALDDINFNPAKALPRHVHPDDGMTYTAKELEAQWELVSTLGDITASRERPFEFHEHARVFGMSKRLLDHVGDIDDEKAVDLLVNDTLKQEEDPLPYGLHEDCSLDCKLDHLPLENGD